MVLSATRGNDANIYLVDLGSRRERQLTSGGGLDVSPCFSPDGTQIVFNSDRGGDQQLYVMDAGGGGVRRISFGRGRYATPVWSPRGDLIAFTRISGGQFGIGVMRPDGSGERILSEGWGMEGPTFAPNGRVHDVFPRDAGARIRAAAAIPRGCRRSTSPASTNGRSSRRPMPPTRPGRRCCPEPRSDPAASGLRGSRALAASLPKMCSISLTLPTAGCNAAGGYIRSRALPDRKDLRMMNTKLLGAFAALALLAACESATRYGGHRRRRRDHRQHHPPGQPGRPDRHCRQRPRLLRHRQPAASAPTSARRCSGRPPGSAAMPA